MKVVVLVKLSMLRKTIENGLITFAISTLKSIVLFCLHLNGWQKLLLRLLLLLSEKRSECEEIAQWWYCTRNCKEQLFEALRG